MFFIFGRIIFYFCIFYHSTASQANAIGKHFLDKLSANSHEDWFETVNTQYDSLLRYSSYIEWEQLVSASDELLDKGLQLSAIKSKWHNLRCSESEEVQQKPLSDVQKRMIYLLCRGPKFTDYQMRELSKVLNRMSSDYSSTRVCLPKNFDICKNSDHIWDFTYMKTATGAIYPLILDGVKPSDRDESNLSKLHYWDGKFDNDYFVYEAIEHGNVLGVNTEFICWSGEPDLERIMEGDMTPFHRSECLFDLVTTFRWAWESWRMAVGPQIYMSFVAATNQLNIGARNAGYKNIGEAWMDELEADANLPIVMANLWNEVKHFYTLLHAVLRNLLRARFYGIEKFDRDDMIPAHILGNMWSQNWVKYLELIVPFGDVNLDANMAKTNWSTIDMVKRAEDFYVSLGLNSMSKKFWDNSVLEMNDNLTNCHGTAANMFGADNDYRMMACPRKTIDDFYVIHHEMGHVQYYMNMAKQAPIFQDGTNTALQESIGDAVFLGVMTPQHLNRLHLIPDKFLFPEKLSKMSEQYLRMVHSPEADDKDFLQVPDDFIVDEETLPQLHEKLKFFGKDFPNIAQMNRKREQFELFKSKYDLTMNKFDLTLLLRTALMKIPQIPFQYIIDTFRWDLFSGRIDMADANQYFWELSEKEQGIRPPNWENRENMFDAGAKFHVANNIPYARYFLASFIQMQIFRSMCEVTVFGQLNQEKKIPMPLHRCDIYGSKRAGKLLKRGMALGGSVHWTEVLHTLTGKREVSADALLEYYQPLIKWLEKLVIEYNIPLGW